VKRKLTVDLRPGDYTVLKLPVDAPAPAGLLAATTGLVSLTRTAQECSVVCPTDLAPPAAESDGGWRLLTVRGPLEFTLTGIMAALSGALAAAGVALFAVSTFDTDHILVKQADLDAAVTALREAGHDVVDPTTVR
jgi:hypothetical protein